MLLVSIKIKDIEILEEIFAVLTPEGWIVPQWLQVLRQFSIT